MNKSQLTAKLPAIKNMVFDMGGVIVNIDYDLTRRAFEELGVTTFGELYSQAAQQGIFDELEKGLITPEVFREKLRTLTSALSLSDKRLDGAWNAMLLDTPAYRLEVVARMKSRFRTFLLSNTNKIHIDYLHSILQRDLGINDFTGYFERAYYSNEIHLRKPDKEIFELVLEENGLVADETLFFDDTVRHVRGAQQVGMHGVHVGSDITLDELYELLADYTQA